MINYLQRFSYIFNGLYYQKTKKTIQDPFSVGEHVKKYQHQRVWKSMREHMRASESIGKFKIIWEYQKLSENIRDYWKISEIIGEYQRLLKNIRNYRRISEIIEKY